MKSDLGIAITSLTLAIRPAIADKNSNASGPSANGVSGKNDSPEKQPADRSDEQLRFGTQEQTSGKVTIVGVNWISEKIDASSVKDVDAVLALDPNAAMLLARHFERRRPENRPRLYSIGMTRKILSKLERAQLDTAVSRQPYGLGYRSVEMLVRTRLELLPRNHPPQLGIPPRIVSTSEAAYHAGQLRDGLKLTFDNRLADTDLSLRLNIPPTGDQDNSDWWELVIAGAKQAAEQFGASLEVVEGPTGGKPKVDVLRFRSDESALVFPVASDVAAEITASSLFIKSETVDPMFVLKTSSQRIANETARLIVGRNDGPVRLVIVCDEKLKPNPESFLPILAKALREL